MANRRSPSDEEILAQLPEASHRQKDAQRRGMRATGAIYDRKTRRIMLELTNGNVFGFTVASIPALKHATENQLADVRVSPSGSALHWEAIDTDLEVPGLIVASLGREIQLREFARAAGSITTDRKAAAARLNGQKGGRPRRSTESVDKVRKPGGLLKRVAEGKYRFSGERKQRDVHIVPTKGGKYVVRLGGSKTPITKPSTQGYAIAKGREIARANQSELITHRRDGSIIDRSSYGKDPNPPRERRK